jgi:hypothetical protein
MLHNPHWADSKGNSKTEKQAKIEKIVNMLKHWNIEWISKNNNVHIYFWIDELRFDVWPSTELMWLKNPNDKKPSGESKIKKIHGTNNILTIIEKELFNL